MAQINLNNTQQPDPIQLDTPERTPDLPPQVISARASRAAFGLGPITGKTYEDIHNEFSSSGEQQFRNSAAAAVDDNNRLKYVQGQLSPNSFINSARTNPRTVIEKHYAGRFLHPLIDATTGPSADAKEEVPEHIQPTVEAASNMVAIRELLNHAREEMDASYKKQPWVQWGAQRALESVPFLAQSVQRGQVPTDTFHILPGEDIAEQSKALYRMPLDQAAETVDRIKEYMKDNPGLASSFFNKLAGMSTDDRVQENIQGLADITAAAPLPVAIAKKLGVLNRFRRAARDVVDKAHVNTGTQEPALDPDVANWENEGGAIGREPVEATSARAAGNLGEAAVHQEASNLVAEAKGISQGQKRAVNSLLSEHRFDVDALLSDTHTPEERELATRIADATHRRDFDVVEALTNAMRANRTPLLETAQDIVRAAEQRIRDNWKGIDNQILDIDTRSTEITNINEHEITIGTTEAKEFDSEETARANAELNGLTVTSEGVGPERREQLLRQIKEAEERLALEEPVEATELGREPREKIEDNISAWRKEIEQPRTEGYDIRPRGNGYVIVYTKPMREFVEATDEKGRGLGYEIPANEAFRTKWAKKDFSLWKWLTTSAFERRYLPGETPYIQARDQGILNYMRAVMGWIRTPEETLAREISEQRGIAAVAPNVLKEVAAGIFREISVPRGYWEDFNRILKAGQSWPNPDTGVPGYTFRTLPELNNAYMTHFHRLPLPQEAEAYFAWSYNNDLDLTLRRIQLLIPKAIRGAEQFQFSTQHEQLGRVKSGFFEGIERKGLPGGDDNILVMGTKAGQEKLYKANDIKFLRQRKGIGESLANGQGKVIEVINPDSFPFKHLGEQGNQLVRYVYIPGTLERKPLLLDGQLPRQGGGHLIPDYDHYIKQAHVHKDTVGTSTRHIYLKDQTLMPMADPVTGRQITAKINRVREVLAKGKGAAIPWKLAKAAFESEKLPFTWEQFSGWFKPSKDPRTGEIVPPAHSIREPFVLVGKDESVYGATGNDLPNRYPGTFVDGTRAGSIAKTIRVEYSQERNMHNLMTVVDKGSNKNPIYSYQPANMMDPIPAQNRGLARIINSTWMNDVKIHSMNKWLKDVEPWVNTSIGADKLWHSPFAYFEEGTKGNFFRPETPFHIKQALLANHFHIKRFLGQSSYVDKALHSFSQILADNIHGIAGPRLVPRQFLASVKDPIPFIRSMTYAVDMGLFSVKQFATQFTTHSNILGMAPTHAPSASMGMYLHGLSTLNHQPAILDALDNLATKMRMPGASYYRPGQWKEARELGINSGFLKVGEEHAFAGDYPASAKLVRSGGQKILDWGRLPFTVGASSVRTTALHTAYLEFRSKNPVGRLTRANKAEILNQARIYDHNMIRSSNSLLHTGVMSVPGQFFAYDLRLAEIMTGKRITPLQKASLFGISSILYGVPVGGLGLYGYPISKWIQKKAIDDYSYVAGAGDKVVDFVQNGLPSLLMQSITGHTYEFSKFGAKGIDYLEEAFVNDVSILKIASGAVGSGLESLFANSNNFYKSIMPEFAGGVKDMKFKPEYMLDAMKTLASYNEGWKWATAIHTGNWMSRNGTVLTNDISPLNATFMALSGVSEQRFSDKFAMDEILRDQDARERAAFGLARDNWGRYLQALKDNSDSANDYKNNAFAILRAAGYPDHKLSQAISSMSRGHESTIRETNRRFMLEAPSGKEGQRLEQFKKMENK